MIERGLIVAGELIAGTEWCLRDSRAWWTPGERGTRARASKTTALVGHWTGGEAGVGDPDGNDGPLDQYDDDGPRVVRGMKARLRPDGTPLSVGIHFVIGACVHAELFANVWQTADPGLVATVHVGRGAVNARSIGVETVSAGLGGRFDVRDRPTKRVSLLGRIKTVLRFYPGQLASWLRLAETLAAIDDGRISIPRCVPVFGASRRMTYAETRRFAGAFEHLHVAGTTKIDAAGLLTDALAAIGWKRAQP